MKQDYSRRKFIRRSMMTGVTLLGAGALLSMCNQNGGKTTDGAVKEGTPVSSCDDMSGVSQVELDKRKILGYVKATPIPDSTCTNCQLYIASKDGANCGGCNLFKGPVFAEGYCTSWAARIEAQ